MTGMRWTVAVAFAVGTFGCGGGDESSRSGRDLPKGIAASGGASAAGSNAGGAMAAGGSNAFDNRDPNAPRPMEFLPRGDAGVCKNLECQINSCVGSVPTSVSGVVYDPAGTNPLYNVVVYVPNAAVGALPQGVSCDQCDSLYMGEPVAAALTDGTGAFKIENVPEGTNIPLVVQIGKWRRQFVLPSVAPCRDNPQPNGMFRLPRNQSEGDLPNIAISTGSADTLECLLRRIGVDASEYVAGEDPSGRVHIFQGADRMGGGGGGGDPTTSPNTAPPGPRSAAALWNSLEGLKRYDILLLSCEGEETQGMNQQVLHDYASAGGRVFASHFHYSWFNTPPYANENLATWTPESNNIGDINGTIVTTLPNGEVFPKGVALRQWLEHVGAVQANGLLPIEEARHNADVSAANTPSQAWIVADQNSEAPGATQYFSFNTPTDANLSPDGKGYCGRVVYSDLHVGAASGDQPEQPVPAECAMARLSPQEAALEFMLFDLSSCVTPDDVPPKAPVVK